MAATPPPAPEVHCPSCGAPLPGRNPGIVVSVCGYCGTIVNWDAEAARDSGRKSRLPQGFTRLYTGARGRLQDRPFFVLGRVRYGWEGGFWDEWAIEVEEAGEPQLHWLTEDDHELAFETRRERLALDLPRRATVGSRVEVGGKMFLIEETGEAACIGVEGQLPERFEIGERYPYADGTTLDGVHTLGIEWDGEPPSIYIGRWLPHEDLELEDEGLEW